jgi:hypothetical protein
MDTGMMGTINSSAGAILLAGDSDDEICVVWIGGVHGTDEIDFGFDEETGRQVVVRRNQPVVIHHKQADLLIRQGAKLISSQQL